MLEGIYRLNVENFNHNFTLCVLNLAGFHGTKWSCDKYLKSSSLSAVFRRLAARFAPNISASVRILTETTVGFADDIELVELSTPSGDPSVSSATIKISHS